MIWVTFLRISFEMLSDFKTLSFDSLWIAYLICFEVIVNEILSMQFADILSLMSLRSAWSPSEKNFSVSICALRMLSLLVLLWSVLHKSEIWDDACDLSVQSLLHCKSLHNSFLWELSETEVDCSMNCLQLAHSMHCSFFLSSSWNNW